jgi:YD repeat-containing protein
MNRDVKTANRRTPLAGMLAGVAAGAAGVLGLVGCGGSESGPVACVPLSGNICTIAGTGRAGDGADGLAAVSTNLYLPQDVTISPAGRPMIVDWNNHRIRELGADGKLRIVAGAGELGLTVDDPATDRLNHPTQLTYDAAGHMVIAAWHNSRVKVVLDPTSGTTTDSCGNGMRGFAGDGGPALSATLNLPVAVVYNADGDLFISDQANQRIRRVDHLTNVITTIAGMGVCAACPLGDGGPATSATFSLPQGQSAQPGGRIDIDTQGNIYLADTGNLRVRKIDGAGLVSTVAGNGTLGWAGDGGPATEAALGGITDVALAPDGSFYIADYQSSCIRAVDGSGIITTVAGVCGSPGFAGDGGPAGAAALDRPAGVALDIAGNLYIADTHNNRIRVVYR